MHQTLEDARLRKLASFHILDTPPEREFDALTALAQRLLDCPIALVSLVDQDRQWFKSAQGMGQVRETPRNQAFCAHTIHEDDLLLIEDACADPRFADNPLVQGKPHIRFYAGVPLRPHHDGYSDTLPALGSFCVIDTKPRHLSSRDLATLRDLAAVAESLLRAHATAEDAKYLAELAEERAEILDGQHRLLRQAEKLASIGSWRLSLDDGVLQWSDQVYVIHGLPIGSTPGLEEALGFYTAEEARRHEVRPGITGWAQLNGRNELPWDEKLALDVWYVEHRSFALDVRILLRTLAVPFARRGISRTGHATAPRLDDERRRA